jgi:hypothetical protein
MASNKIRVPTCRRHVPKGKPPQAAQRQESVISRCYGSCFCPTVWNVSRRLQKQSPSSRHLWRANLGSTDPSIRLDHSLPSSRHEIGWIRFSRPKHPVTNPDRFDARARWNSEQASIRRILLPPESAPKTRQSRQSSIRRPSARKPVGEAIRRPSVGMSRKAGRAERSGARRSGTPSVIRRVVCWLNCRCAEHSPSVYSGHGEVNWTLMYRLISWKPARLCVTRTNPLSLHEAASR